MPAARRESIRPRRTPRSPNELWAWAKQIDGYPDTEWTFSVFLSRVTWLESLWPQPFYEYGSTYEDAFRLLRFQRELHGAGVPEAFLPVVTLGVEWFDSGLRAVDGRLPIPGSDDPFRGRHRVIASGWEDGGESLVFTNSWGRWGKDGKGLISREYFEAYADDVYFERSVAIGLNPAADAAFAKLGTTYTPQELAKAWLTPNPPVEGGLIHRGIRTTMARFTTYSLRGPLVEIFELRQAGHAIARCHLFHEPERTPSGAVLEELFVHPRFRQQGFGSLLEREAARSASAAGHELIEIALYEADGRPRGEAARTAFAERAGYRWRQERLRRPNRVATAFRTL